MPEPGKLTYPSIQEPTHDIESIRTTISQLKEAVELLTGQRGPREYTIQDGLAKIEYAIGNSKASIRELNNVVVDANSAMAERVTIVEAEITSARAGQPSLAARVTQVVNAQVAGDAANASTTSTLQAEITAARGGQPNVAANISNVASVAASANAATALSVTNLTTTVDGNTSNINTTISSVNGLKVKYGVEGSVGGVYGGFVLSGIARNDATPGSPFLFDITANVVINGNLLVNGSVKTLGIETNGVSRAALSTAATYFDDVSITLRAGASVLVIGTLKGETGYAPAVGGDGIARLRVRLGGGALSDIESAYQVYDSTVVSGTPYFRMQTTTIQTRYVPGSDGTYTFRIISGDTATPGAAITVLETVR